MSRRESLKYFFGLCPNCNVEENLRLEEHTESSGEIIIYTRCKGCGFVWE